MILIAETGGHVAGTTSLKPFNGVRPCGGNTHSNLAAFLMRIFKQSPSPELRPFIDRLWGWESDSSENVHLPTLLPGTGAELYFHYGEMFRFSVAEGQTFRAGHGHLFCIRRTPIRLLPTSGIGFIAVRFRIGMLQRFTRIPACELEDDQREVDDIWGGLGAQLLRQLSYATGHQERTALIQSFLIGQLNPESSDLLVERAMGMLYRRRLSLLSIDDLAGCLHLGRRQLERRFKVFSGKSPIEIRSLIRFQHTIRSLLLSPLLGVADAAVSGGYYDQAHFIHDFQSRVGVSPHHHLLAARAKTHFYNTPLGQKDTLPTPNQTF